MNIEEPVLKNSADSRVDTVTLDLALARQNFGCDEELLCEIATVFIEDVPVLIQELEDARQRGDVATICRMAHSLKGLCATFGAEPARTYAQRIEIDCSQSNAAAVTQECVRTLVLLLERTIATLRNELRLSA